MKLIQRIVLTFYSAKFRAMALISREKAAKAAFEFFCTPYSKRRTFEAPGSFKKANKLTFEFQNHQIHGFQWKPTVPNGYKILICHGFDSQSYKFDSYVEPLLHQGFELFAFDAPAHGLSSGKTITAVLYSDMLTKVFAEYGPFGGIIAHSFGGIAVTLALEQLEGNLPKRLVLIAPATETTRSLNDFCRLLKISRDVKKDLEKLILQISGQPVSWFSVARIIPSLSIPTLWLHDVKDTVTPYDDMKHLPDLQMPHVESVLTENLGHSLYKDEAVAKKIIGFLVTLKNNIY